MNYYEVRALRLSKPRPIEWVIRWDDKGNYWLEHIK